MRRRGSGSVLPVTVVPVTRVKVAEGTSVRYGDQKTSVKNDMPRVDHEGMFLAPVPLFN